MLELIYFIAGVFGEKLSFETRSDSALHNVVDKADRISLLSLLIVPPLFNFFAKDLTATSLLFTFYIWGIIATIQLAYHIRHRLHWVAIIISAYLVSVFLHEIPNTNAFEWRYFHGPILNQNVLGIPLYIFLGWYILSLMMVRLWVYFVLDKDKN